MKTSAKVAVAVLACALTVLGCNEDSVSGPGFICDVTNPVGDILVSPSSARIVVHSPVLDTDTTKVVATATDRFGAARTDVRISFSSSDTTIATVDTAGVVHARKAGTATIKAFACGESSTTVVTVVANVVRVALTPASDTVLVGDSVTYRAQAFGAGNSLVPGTKFTFTISPTSTATVSLTSDSTVSVKGVAAGSATLTATAEGISGTAAVLVLPPLFLAGSAATATFDAGDDLSCGIITLGHSFCWGLNNHGQLGALSDSICFAGSDSQKQGKDSLVTTAVACSLNPRRLVTTQDFATIAAGDSSACAISLGGRAYCWGAGVHGELGNGSTGSRSSPGLVTGALNFSFVTVGGSHACALTTTNAAYCWGSDSTGQLGDARRVNSTTPIPVSGGGGPATFSSISAGFRHTCAVASDGTGFCWGNNDFGQLGDGSVGSSDTPVQVGGGVKFNAISAGGDHSCGITTAGAALCWGSNSVGQLGNGSVGGFSPSPVAVSGGQTFSRISASTGTQTGIVDSLGVFRRYKEGSGHTCALTTAGAIFCWGDNVDLQLGQGPFSGGPSGVIAAPVRVIGGELPGTVTFVSVSTGSRHSCGVGSDGAAYCWGSNVFGALGNTLQAAFRGLPQRVATPR